MSDLENQALSSTEDSPRPKRSRISKPLSQKNSTTKRSHTPVISEIAAKKIKSNKISRLKNADDGDSVRFINSSAGVLKKIKLVNFMCHSHFEITFNPRINFISGCNGSGKSAIQTAIVIGLGGVASKTNRSSKIDGLIKHGCSSGSVTITLSNNGWNAYKPENYGNTIAIVRNITTTSSSYKIYNQWGKLMSNGRKELDAILTKFRIQPNNPVSVLNQDMARNFLSTNKAESKYALFKKATSLDEAEELLLRISDEILEQETRIEAKKKAVQHIQEEIDKMTEKIQLVENVKKSREQKFELQNELAWSKVHIQRNDLSSLKNISSEQEKIKSDLEFQIKQHSEMLIDLESRKRGYDETIANIQNECKNREQFREKLNVEFRQQKKVYEMKCMKCEETETKIRNLKSDRSHLQKSLDEVEKAEMEYKQKKQKAATEKANYEAQLKVYESKIKVLGDEMTRLKTTAEHYKEKMHQTDRLIHNYEQQIAQCRQYINSLGVSDSLSMYEGWMPELVKHIEAAVKANIFSKPPRGPLGRYIKVKDEKWICCIESYLSHSFLSSFYVNNAKDRDVLFNIMTKVITKGPKPTIHCSAFQEEKRDDMLPRIETSYPGYSNMYRALTINDTVVANFLIDLRNIQRILLVDKDEECRRFISDDSHIPPKCNLILNLGADEFRAGYRIYANLQPLRRGRILRKSAADQLKGLKEEIEEKEALIEQAKTEKEEYRQSCNLFHKKINDTSIVIREVKSSISEIKRTIQELSTVMEMETPSLQVQLDELKEVEKEIAELEMQKKVLQEERDEDGRKMQDAKNQLHSESQNDFFGKQTELNASKEKVLRQLIKIQNLIKELEKKLNEQNEKINTLKTRIKNAEQKLATEEDSASQLSEEYTQARSVSEIQNEICALQCYITEAEKKLGTEEINFEKQYWDKKSAHYNFVKLFKELTDLHKKLKKMNIERKNVIASLRDVNANVIIAEFQVVLKSRNYMGSLKFDHEHRKLDILMAPTDGGNTLMNTNSLSGGEKSYSTVAFLLALWSNMELPFYSLDEYDVFMDAINRKTITKLLMAFAEKKDSRQFIFLTPLDVSIIQPGPHVQIHKVKKIQQ